MEACKSKRKSRTDRIINISWSYFILLGHQWNLCNRGNSWNAIFLADLSKIKEGSIADPEKTVLTVVTNPKSGFVGESMVLTAECQSTDFMTRVWTRHSLFADATSHIALDTNQTHQKVHNLSMEHNCIQIIWVSGHVCVRSLIVEPRDKHVTTWNLGITGPSCLSGLFYKHLI